jgi:hypothetical protein
VVDLPAAEVRAVHFSLLALAVRRQDERAFSRTDQQSYMTHYSVLLRRLHSVWISNAL